MTQREVTRGSTSVEGFGERRELKETEACETDVALAVVAVALERIVAVVRRAPRAFPCLCTLYCFTAVTRKGA